MPPKPEVEVKKLDSRIGNILGGLKEYMQEYGRNKSSGRSNNKMTVEKKESFDKLERFLARDATMDNLYDMLNHVDRINKQNQSYADLASSSHIKVPPQTIVRRNV